MSKSGGIISIIAGVLGLLAAAVTLLAGGLGAAFKAEGASTIIGLGWGGVFFCFLSIIFGAVAINAKSRMPGVLIIISSIFGAIYGGTLVAILMLLALVGGILATLGTPETDANITSNALVPPKSDSGIELGAILVILITISYIFQATYKPKNGSTLHTESAAESNPLTKLDAAVPSSDIVPYGQLEEMFTLGSDFTDLQREIKFKEIKGKIVSWRLPVYDIHLSGEEYIIQTNSHYKDDLSGIRLVGTFVHVTARNNDERRLIESLKTGDTFTFKGVIDDTSMRNLDIKPALLLHDISGTDTSISEEAGAVANNSAPAAPLEAAAYAAPVATPAAPPEDAEAAAPPEEPINKPSPGKAIQQAKALAAQGDVNAQVNLGAMFYAGQNVPQDYAQAIQWFRKAADQGDSNAQVNLGNMYYSGQGVPHDYSQAMIWYNIAKASGSTNADKNLQHLESQSTPTQIADAQRMAQEWWAAHPKKN